MLELTAWETDRLLEGLDALNRIAVALESIVNVDRQMVQPHVSVGEMGSGPYGVYHFIECSLCGTVDSVPLKFAAQRANAHRESHADKEE